MAAQVAIPLIMAAISALGGGMQAFGKNKPAENTQLPTVSPSQKSFLDSILGLSQQGLQNPYAGFDPIQQQATEQFTGSVLPNMAEQFAGVGGANSSGYEGMMSGANADFGRQMAALRAQYGLQNRNSLLNMGQLGMTPQFSNMYEPRSAGMLQSIGSGLMGGGLGGFGTAMGGLMQASSDRRNSDRAMDNYYEMQRKLSELNRRPGGQ